MKDFIVILNYIDGQTGMQEKQKILSVPAITSNAAAEKVKRDWELIYPLDKILSATCTERNYSNGFDHTMIDTIESDRF